MTNISQEIKIEIKKYDINFALKFFDIFESKKFQGCCFLPICNKTHISQLLYLYYDSEEIFWSNWNKYLKMKAFL